MEYLKIRDNDDEIVLINLEKIKKIYFDKKEQCIKFFGVDDFPLYVGNINKNFEKIKNMFFSNEEEILVVL